MTATSVDTVMLKFNASLALVVNQPSGFWSRIKLVLAATRNGGVMAVDPDLKLITLTKVVVMTKLVTRILMPAPGAGTSSVSPRVEGLINVVTVPFRKRDIGLEAISVAPF